MSRGGRYPEAIVEFQKAISLSAGNSTFLTALGHAYAVAGQRTDAAEILQQLQKLPLATAFDISLLHAGLGHNDQAFLWLGKACDERDYWIGTLAVELRFEPLRSDPRFGDLLHRLGLLQQ